MNASQALVSAGLAAAAATLNGGSLIFYSGAMPATPETALSGNTALCTATYSATAFGTPTFTSPNMVATASFSASSFTPTATGNCTFARGLTSGSAACADFTVGSPWIASQAVALGQYCTSGGNTYKCTTAGTSSTTTPSGTTTFTDGTVTWTYVGAGQQFDILLNNAIIQTSVPITLTQTLSQAAV